MIIIQLFIITILAILLYKLWKYYDGKEKNEEQLEIDTLSYLKKLNEAKSKLKDLGTEEDVEMLNSKIVEKELYLKQLRKNIKQKRKIKV